MGIFDNFLDVLKLNEDSYDDDDYMDDEYDDEEEYEEPQPRKIKKKKSSHYEDSFEEDTNYGNSKSFTSRNTEDTQLKAKTRNKPQAVSSRSNSKLVQLNSARGNKLFVIKPQDFNESQSVVDFLKEDKIIVINMDGLDIDLAQRIIDFIGGACYAMEGTLQAVSRSIFIAAPSNTEVSGDLRDEVLSESGVTPDLHNNY